MSLFDAHLTKTRSDNQRSELFLALYQPQTIFTAQVNQTFTNSDGIAEIAYDNATGSYGDVYAGMTMLVGSTAGASDLGVVRIRKAPTSSKIYFGETSEIEWEDELHLTIVYDFVRPYQRHPRIDDDVVYMDYDIEYVAQHSEFSAVPVMGQSAVLWLESGSASVTFDSTDSWVIDGTITERKWYLDNTLMSTDTSYEYTFTSAGTYVIGFVLVTDGGEISVGFRYVFVFDDDNMPLAYDSTGFELTTSPSGSIDTGWSFGVRLFDEDAVDSVSDGAFCVLFARDYYQDEEGSLGLVDGRDNILSTGWIDGKSITRDPEQTSTEFNAYGLNYWLEKMFSFPVGVANTDETPAGWTEIQDLTVDKALYHLLWWHTNIMTICDVYLTDDTREYPAADAQGATIWEQIKSISFDAIRARPVSDRFGRLFVSIPHNLTPSADRGSLDIMTITDADIAKTIDATREPKAISQVRLSGVAGSSPLFSNSPGSVPAFRGDIITADSLLLSSQSQSNTLAGLIYSDSNNPYPSIPVDFVGNNRAFSLAPNQYGTADLDFYSGKLLPAQIGYSYNASTGRLSSSVVFAGETFAAQAATYTPPQTPDINAIRQPNISAFDDFALEPFGGLFDTPSLVAREPDFDEDADGCRDNTDASANGNFELFVSSPLYSNSKDAGFADFPCYVRSVAHTNQTQIIINGRFETRNGADWEEDETDTSWYQVKAIDREGDAVTTATKEAFADPESRTFTFTPPASIRARGFGFFLDLDANEFDDATSYLVRDTGTGGDTSYVSGQENFFEQENGIKGFSTSTYTFTGGLGYSPNIAHHHQFVTPVSSDYFDVYWLVTITGQLPQTLSVYISRDNGGTTLYTNEYEKNVLWKKAGGLAGTIDNYIVEIEYSREPLTPVTYPHTVTINIKTFVKTSAEHRIVFDRADVYNVCPPIEE